tara:strand:+ start:288 stop:782 length:495 start_codon:yes stop_codon:yes gene_type:complete
MDKPIDKKPTVKTQGARYISPIENYIGYHTKAYASEYEKPESMTPAEKRMGEVVEKERYNTRIQEQDKQKKPARMSATRSWQIIKQSMDKDELEEHYKQNPKGRPIKLTPFKPDPMLEEIYQGTVVNPKFEAVKRQYLKDEEARRIEKKHTARSGIKTILNFYK